MAVLDGNSGKVDVFDDSFHPAGTFTDPNVPSGYAPFGIQELNGKLFVTFAQQDQDKHDDVAGPGHGFVDVFNNDGVLLRRLISQGDLNSPWGLVIAQPLTIRPGNWTYHCAIHPAMLGSVAISSSAITPTGGGE